MRDANCHDHVGVGQGASVPVRVYESIVGVCIWLDSVRACRFFALCTGIGTHRHP